MERVRAVAPSSMAAFAFMQIFAFIIPSKSSTSVYTQLMGGGTEHRPFLRSAFESSMEALKQPTIRVVAVIAEGVPEADTKKLIAYARKHNKILIGPATVGGVQVDPRHACSDVIASLHACSALQDMLVLVHAHHRKSDA